MNSIQKAYYKSLELQRSRVEELADYLRKNTWPSDGSEDIYPVIVEFGRAQFALGQITPFAVPTNNSKES